MWAASTVAGALSGAEPGESRPSDLIDRRIAVTVGPAPARRAGLACGFGFVQLGLPEGVSFEQEPGWLEPGVEQHAWESEYEAILPLIEDDPAEALPEFASLVERMLVDRGYLTRPRGLDRSEHAVTVAAAREVSERWRAGEDVDPGDIGFAIGELRAICGSLLADASTA